MKNYINEPLHFIGDKIIVPKALFDDATAFAQASLLTQPEVKEIFDKLYKENVSLLLNAFIRKHNIKSEDILRM